ncbi:MAG: FKBP-type peptidyl-prolyl cis-trans isomerase [Pseudomonadota bacterium]|nr:FKBP-type peptidyl-prolyl cis-trans isomerase [Pseudomonadota bacterium]
MSITQVPLRPIARGSLLKLWLAIAALIAGAFLLAQLGTAPLRGETTPSGLMFRTIEPGEGDRIKLVDGALIEYEGRLPDGTVFDSTEGRGPAPILPAQVIPGFGEALQMMQKGGRYAIRIPPSLAYGDTPPPGGVIPAGSDLLFDVHVVQVVPNAALMAQSQAGAPSSGPPPGQ